MLKTDLEVGIAGDDNTSREISGQPALWQDTYRTLLDQQQALVEFLQPLWDQDNLNVVLTGAGTSAFIGEALQGPFFKNTGKLTRAIATTELVSHPSLFLRRDSPTLLVSFARSGNSPESVAAVEVANALCDTVYHLVITCNKRGKLAQQENSQQYTLLLPPAANDKGLAMTGSFSAMLLTGLLVSRWSSLASLQPQIEQLVAYGQHLLQEAPDLLQKVAELPFERIIFLGSGPLRGTAQESHLKVQELTDGQVVGKHDSFLGFRHGPKVVANHQSLVVLLFSNDAYVRPYEVDLARELHQSGKAQYTIGVAERPVPGVEVDQWITMTEHDTQLDEELLAVCSVLPAQIIGYYKSRQLGLVPDNPSVNGTISRVVKGVTIYPYPLSP